MSPYTITPLASSTPTTARAAYAVAATLRPARRESLALIAPSSAVENTTATKTLASSDEGGEHE